MSHSLLEPAELRQRGFDVLVEALGWVNAVRFMHQYETSRLDYTADREGILPTWDNAELVRRLETGSGGPDTAEQPRR